MASIQNSDEWKRLVQSSPALCAAIEKNRGIRVGEFLQIRECTDATYDHLPLSARALNCLDREGFQHRSITDILNMPLARLAGMRNAGAKTISEILEAISTYAKLNPASKVDISSTDRENPEMLSQLLTFLRPYTDLIAKEKWDDIELLLETEEQLDALLKVMDIAEVIGVDMVAAALSSSYPVTVLLPLLARFVKDQQVCDAQTKQLKAMVDALPEDRKSLPVKPFALAWPGRASISEFENAFDDMMTFVELVHQDTNYSDEEFRALESFLAWCCTSVESEVTRVVKACLQKDRIRDVTLYRAQGKTLEEVGALFNITRERVRQIEKKAIRIFHVAEGETILLLISAIRHGDEILTSKEILDYCGDDGILFLHFLRNAESNGHFRYAKPLDAFILGNSHLEEEHVHAFVDELPDRIDVTELKTYLDQAAREGLPPELIELQIRNDYQYKESILAWQRGRLNLRKMCREILPEFDPDGIHTSAPAELQLFREKLYARFGSDIHISESDHALITVIANVGMLRDRGTYVSARDHILSDDLLERIHEYVDQGENDVYMFSTLFEVFKPELLQAGVDNRYFLQGILRREWDQLYSFSRDCISKGGRASNIYGTVEQFIKNAGRYVLTSEIKEAFPGITGVVLNLALTQKHIITCNGKYIHAENLHLTAQHIRDFKQTLDMLLADGQAHHSRELFSLASTYNSSWLEEIGVMYQSALFGIAAYLYDSDCVFSRPWIAARGSAGEETIRQLRSRNVEAAENKGERYTEPVGQTVPTMWSAASTVEPAIDAQTASRWNAILSEEFEDGLRLNGMRLRKFRSICEERYHETLEPDDEKLIALLKQVGEERDERIYARRNGEASSLMDTIRQDILQTLSAGASCVYPQQIFEKYRAELARQLTVYNADAFKAMLLSSTGRQLSASHGIICLPGKNGNIAADVMNLFQDSYVPISYAQMAEQLWYIPMERIKHVLSTEKSIVTIEQETYFYAPNFPISTHELTALARAMHRRIEDDGFLVAKDLRELMQVHCPNAAMDTADWKDWGVRNVMTWLLRDQFDFNGVIICARGVGMDTHMVFRSYCKAHKRVTMDELKDLCAQLGVSGICWDSVLAEMVRISRSEFISKRLIAFDSESTDRVLEQACPGDYMPLKDFTLFMGLPGVAVPWNGFLLESYLRDYSRVFRLEQAGPVEHTPIGAMVRRTSTIRSNRDLLIDALAHEDSWHNTGEALDVLVARGYRAQRLMANATDIIKAAQQQREKLKAAEK